MDDRIETLLAAAVTGNTESGIDVTYDAGTGKLNFAVHSGSGGATFRMGAGAPDDSLGADTDTYLNITAGIFYDKAAAPIHPGIPISTARAAASVKRRLTPG